MVACQKQKDFGFSGQTFLIEKNVIFNLELMFSQLLSWSGRLMVFVSPYVSILLFWKQLVDLAVFFLEIELVIILSIKQMKNLCHPSIILSWNMQKSEVTTKCFWVFNTKTINMANVFRHLWEADISLMSILLRSRIWVLIGIVSRHSQLIVAFYSQGRSTRFDRLYDFFVNIPRCYKDVYVNNFFSWHS